MQESDKNIKNGLARFLQNLKRYPIIFFRLLYRSLVCQARLMDVFTKELYQMTEVSLLLRCWVDNLVTCEWSEWSYNGWISQGQPDLAPVSRTWDTHWSRHVTQACALLEDIACCYQDKQNFMEVNKSSLTFPLFYVCNALKVYINF